MCRAFSCVIERTGEVHWKLGMDSHSDIVEMSGLDDVEADRSKLQFARVEIIPRNGDYRHPDEWVLIIDEQAKPRWWSPTHEVKCRRAHKKWCEQLYEIVDCDTVIEHPFRDIDPPAEITQTHIDLLHQWASVEDSVWARFWDSIEDSVWDSFGGRFGDSVWDIVWESVKGIVGTSAGDSAWDSVGLRFGDSVEDSIWDSFGDSAWDSFGGCVAPSVRVSVGDSVWAQIGALFRLERAAWKYTKSLPLDPAYPFQAAVDLWNLGLVPSFDGKTWRLHGGPDGRVLYEEEICR